MGVQLGPAAAALVGAAGRVRFAQLAASRGKAFVIVSLDGREYETLIQPRGVNKAVLLRILRDHKHEELRALDPDEKERSWTGDFIRSVVTSLPPAVRENLARVRADGLAAERRLELDIDDSKVRDAHQNLRRTVATLRRRHGWDIETVRSILNRELDVLLVESVHEA